MYMNNTAPDGVPTDTQWFNFDYDGIPTEGGLPGEWFAARGWAENDTNTIVYASRSWLVGYDPGNLNYLITPAVFVDSTAKLHWKSAPRQTPSYCDGYRVAISTTDNLETSFNDTIFKAAEFAPNGGPGGPGSPAIASFNAYAWGEGWIHGWDGTGVYYDGDSTSFYGLLVDHEVSLAQYAGIEIYIAFIHTSADDNFIAVDDILVMGTETFSIEENELDASMNVYPNPAVDMITVEYVLNSTSDVVVEITDINGKEILHEARGVQIAGNHAFDQNVSDLPAGTYMISINTNDARSTKTFVKQ